MENLSNISNYEEQAVAMGLIKSGAYNKINEMAQNDVSLKPFFAELRLLKQLGDKSVIEFIKEREEDLEQWAGVSLYFLLDDLEKKYNKENPSKRVSIDLADFDIKVSFDVEKHPIPFTLELIILKEYKEFDMKFVSWLAENSIKLDVIAGLANELKDWEDQLNEIRKEKK